jgi:hypothetical protein
MSSTTSCETVQFLQLIIQLLQIFVWPAFGVFLVCALKKPLVELLEKTSLRSLKLPGIELELSNRIESAAAAGAAIAQSSTETPERIGDAVRNIARVLLKPAMNVVLGQKKRILWVDDRPSNNRYLINAFSSLGIRITTALSTTDAINVLKQSSFDLVISDMGRPPDNEAGITLLKEMRKMGNALPVYIFAGGWASGHYGEEDRYGFAKITNNTSEIYSSVLKALSQS